MSSAYGYHSPVGQHQTSPALVNHYGSNVSYHNAGENYRPYAYRIDPLQPVDFSGQVNPLSNQVIEPRCNGLTLESPTNNNNNNNNIGPNVKLSIQSLASDAGSPPAKRRALTRLEPLSLPDHGQDTSSDELLPSEPNFPTVTASGDGGAIMLTTTVLPLRYSHAHIKATAGEPTDLIDQWNPSPPWSETTQKVPDAQQELCYLSRTPPTPTSAPMSSNSVAFSFDWMPEQFVPIVDAAHSSSSLSHSPPQSMPMSSVGTVNEHKFYVMHNLDRSPDDGYTNRKQS